MRVKYADNLEVDEEYEVCWRSQDNKQENSELFATLPLTEALRSQLEEQGIDVSIYLLSTYFDALGDEARKETELIYRTGEQQDE